MSPVVIGGFAAIDAALVAQLAYAARDYQRRARRRATRVARVNRMGPRVRKGR